MKAHKKKSLDLTHLNSLATLIFTVVSIIATIVTLLK